MIDRADVVIVGTGAAGLFCALQLPPACNVLMITKDQAENSDSYLAQGGIATLKSPEDYQSYFEDTMRAGHYKNDPASVAMMIRSSPEIIRELLRLGVDFEQNADGLCYTREGAHSTYRILYHEDVTGKEITSKLLAQVRERSNIRILEYTMMLDILREGGVCKGIVVQDAKGSIGALLARCVVLATGGLGGLFRHSTNFAHITGDALAIALKNAIQLRDMSYIQIHPTTLYSKKPGRRFLISESVRGEGAILRNAAGERFVDELLPRDLLTKAIVKQMRSDGRDYVYLCMQHMEEQVVRNRFPNIFQHCLEEGYNLAKDCIPITPAQHYFMGGIQVDLRSKTSLPRLYAVGETSCNGVHGANRLASNSLLESLVFAQRAAKEIAGAYAHIALSDKDIPGVDFSGYEDIPALRAQYKRLIMNEIKRRDAAFYDQWCNDEN